MNKAIEDIILEVIREDTKMGFNHKQISFRLPPTHNIEGEGLIRILGAMTKKGLLVYDSNNGKYKAEKKKIKGEKATIEIQSRGGIYALLEESQLRVSVPFKEVNKAFNRDEVEVLITQKGNRPSKAEVIKILNRAKDQYVGTIAITPDGNYFEPDDKRIYKDFIIDRKEKIEKYMDGYKLIVTISRWDKPNHSPICVIKKILGKPGENETEILAISEEFGIEADFPEAVINEVQKIEWRMGKEELAMRKDFRDVTTLTIDPHDAKDFDDALSYKVLGEDRYEVGIHIADVSHFVVPGTQLDKEAYNRATSTYLVDRVIPMLPEKLSNDLCSLVPNKDRFCFAAVFEMDGKGKVLKEWFGRTVIHSNKRLSYEEAQDRIENDRGEYAQEIITLNSIAKELTKERFEHGAMSFETKEVKFNLDKNGKPLGVVLKERKDAHKMIEEFMLMANKRVAKCFSDTTEKNKAAQFVYRAHGEPGDEKLMDLSTMARRFGYTIKVGDYKELKHSINEMLADCAGKPEENMLQNMAIRSMAKAVYTTKSSFHFGLGFDHYTHFTSPIRRYPDLMVHRLLQAVLDGQNPSVKNMEKDCAHCSEMEQKATDAERASIKFKQAEYLMDKKGELFEGVVTGLTDWGMFVELEENKCEGLIRLNTIKGDYFEFDSKRMRVRGRRKGKSFEIGQKVKVIVAGANPGKRQIDFELV